MQENETSETTPETQPSSPPADLKDEPQMSEIGTLGGIFFEPEETFKDLRRKPRFIIAGVIIALLVGVYTFGVNYKVGEAGMRRFIQEQMDKNPQMDSMTPEQKSQAVDLQMTITRYSQFAVPIFVLISFVIGGLLYWLGAKAFGGTGGFLHNMSVWIYSGFAPGLVAMVANFIVMIFKSADDIDLAASQRGLVHANLGFFVGKEQPMLATLLSTIDVFAIWGWILAAIGLSVVNKISKGAAWTLVFVIVFIGLIFRLIGAMFSGNPS